jgi:cytochrome d ubiquinol oxidase subunit I
VPPFGKEERLDLDPLLLARIQFAFTISFHIIFPAFTIGLSAYIAVLEILWLRTGAERFHRIARFWTKIFAVSFAMGVVSGIVLSYQFGTNWSRFSETVGNVIGPLIGYEVLTAFFLEASFLGIMLFGWNRVPPWVHAMSSVIVALGTAMSAFWILSANSWMQTPTGYEAQAGILLPADWLQIIFNPSFPYRFAHMLIAAYLTTALVVLAVGCRYLVQNRHGEDARTMVRMAVMMIAITAPLQIFVGDQHGLNTLEHQPVKVAAMEGHWDGAHPVELLLFAIPDEASESNRYSIGVPNIGSLILTHSATGLIKGLKDFPADERPPVVPVFYAFRVMVGIGLLMLVIGFGGALLWWRDRLFDDGLYQRLCQHAWPLGFIAILAGWLVTEIGRQPWIVYGLMRTADATSPVSGASVATSLALFVAVYGTIFPAGIYFINRLIALGPQGEGVEPPHGVPSRPLSAAEEAARQATGKPPGDRPGRPLTIPGS